MSAEELTVVGDDRLVGFIGRLEEVRNRLGLVDHEIVHACQATDLPHRLQLRTVANLLGQVTRIQPGQAHARVRAADTLRAGRSMTGEPLAPTWPRLAAAVASGLVPPVQADIALRCLSRIERLPWTNREAVEIAEAELAAGAVVFPPREFAEIVQRVTDHNDPDGTLADDQLHEATRRVTFYQARDGSWRMEARFTPTVGAQINAVIGPLTKPQHGPDGQDLRSPEERAHDAIADVFARILRAGDAPAAGGVPATVVVTIDYRHLLDDTGYGRLPDGTPIAPSTLLKLACEADIIPVVLGAFGEVLDLGRNHRVANKTQTMALIARDKGCSFPSCGRPAAWCERHHIIGWEIGGLTDLTNLTLLCRYHHQHFQRQGWQCDMIDGLPWWIPPRWIDPDQTPMINNRIRPPEPHRRT
ncbi:HNH endonuclease signature motif containing protein [Microlunatus soli]|uniref:HNH endonuclease signature motif containing protein n=1 Tax=Microlunatus soli TaxID=630515 RepID=UPI001561995B|nr:HNH endonuclease signature motif containing protein [Microlunatus soli]